MQVLLQLQAKHNHLSQFACVCTFIVLILPSKNRLARNMHILQVFFLQDLQDLALDLVHILQVWH